MDLTGIFISRTFNKEVKVGDTPPPLHHPNSKHNWDKVPFTGGTRVIDYDADYKSLKEYYRNAEREDDDIDDTSIDEEYEQQGDYAWARKHFEKWDEEERGRRIANKRKLSRYTTVEADSFTQDNDMKLYDDIIPMMNQVYQSKVLSADDEIDLMRSYHRGEDYLDKYNNTIRVINRTDEFIEGQMNLHIMKLNNPVLKFKRVAFLERMGFKPGTITQDI